MHLRAPDGCVRIEMSTSRIEVPFTLPAPHFDDDATIATARKVVPINSARKIAGRRRVFTLLPLLIASTLCGAVGAIAVNYFEPGRDTPAPVTRPQPHVSTQAKTEPSPVAIAPELDAKNTEIEASVQPEDKGVIPAHETSTKSEAPEIEKRENDEPKSAPPAPSKQAAAQDAAKLVRKRRVDPPDPEIPVRRSRRAEASRIEDLFTGPNP